MGKEEYFRDWLRIIDRGELERVTKTLEPLYKATNLCPSMNNVFRAFNICPYGDLKVVMLGQDPYPQRGVATGILFGNSLNVSESNISPSLKVVKSAVVDSMVPQGPIRFDNSLESWAKQGILMINSALTVEVNKIGSHTMLWRRFISKLLQNLSDFSPGLIYVLWGSQAQTFEPYISKNNTIFKLPHPAYFARTDQKLQTSLFEDINNILMSKNNTQIIWYE